MMSNGVVSFQQRAARLLASDEAPTLDVLYRLITDGCAEALNLETEMSRLTRRREAAMLELDRPDRAREVVELSERQQALEERLDAIQDAVGGLMRRRSRLRLTNFLAER